MFRAGFHYIARIIARRAYVWIMRRTLSTEKCILLELASGGINRSCFHVLEGGIRQGRLRREVVLEGVRDQHVGVRRTFVSHHEEFLHEKIPEYTERHQVLGKTQGYQTPKTEPYQEGPYLEGQGT